LKKKTKEHVKELLTIILTVLSERRVPIILKDILDALCKRRSKKC
jgi:hypothetical protein